jgi:hypothetical protein
MTDNHNEDELLKRMLRDLHNSIEIPDGTDSWNAMKSKWNRRERRKKHMRRLRLAAGLVCAALLLSFLIANNGSRAYASISSFFKDIQNHMIEIFLKKPAANPKDALTSPPSGEGTIIGASNAAPEKVTLSEAKEKLAFPVLLPSTLPEPYRLHEIRLFKEADNQYRSIYLEYSDPQGSIIKLSERMIVENSGIKTEIPEGAGAVKDVKINGNPGVLMILPEGMVNVEWIADDIKISLSGYLSEQEALDWANAIQ